MLHKESSHCNTRPPLAATRESLRAATKTQHRPQKDKSRKLCTQSREDTPKVGSTGILPAFLFPRTQTCSVDPAVLDRTSLRFTVPAPCSWRKATFPGPLPSSPCCRVPCRHNPLVLTECWACRQLWCDQQDGRSNTAQPRCCLKYPKVMGTLYLLTSSGSGSLETE